MLSYKLLDFVNIESNPVLLCYMAYVRVLLYVSSVVLHKVV